jgi:MOSC domain-containing protein YiiM
MSARVVAVHTKAVHAFSKDSVPSIELVAGYGVRADAHYGATVKHRSRVAKDPTQPNLRQVHLLASELLVQLAASGMNVLPGQMGENITTTGLDLLALSEGAILRVGSAVLLRITGLRNPCAQIEAFMPGLLAAVLERMPNGSLVRKAGVMGVVLESGTVYPGDIISVVHSPALHTPLRPV